MAAVSKVTVDVAMTINGERYCGALVVGPDDVLVLNLGPRAAIVEASEFIRRWMSDQHPDISSRTVIVAAEDMAVIRAEEEHQIVPVGGVILPAEPDAEPGPGGTYPDVTPDGVSTVQPGRAGG